MPNPPQGTQCTDCGAVVSSTNGVFLTHDNKQRFICSACFNAMIAKGLDIPFEHLDFHPVTLADVEKNEHTFRFFTRLFGDKVSITAIEVREEEAEGYEFEIIDMAVCDLFSLFGQLIEKIKRGLAKRHLKPGGEDAPYDLTDEAVIRGRITWDEKTDGESPALIIDGKKMSWYELGQILASHEGAQFKMEIFDMSDEK
ncbi:hypothetical protein [Desulfoluna sp.]|uniref:DUF7686 domain-containing protein n=1 Tax=Desulfoluna sp. TaxID=2045199 RepID=UPI002623B796|nr:hypothetical protein [Desulfoluna sp.]